MNLEQMLAEIKNQIKSLLDAADALIAENKIEDAKAKQAEIKTLRERAEVIKSQIEDRKSIEVPAPIPAAPVAVTPAGSEVAALQKSVDDLRKSIIGIGRGFPSFLADDGKDDELLVGGSSPSQKAAYQLRFGNVNEHVDPLLIELYGPSYQQDRTDQMKAFVKYVRGARMSSREEGLLANRGRNILIAPEVLINEIKTGRLISEIKATLEESSNELGGYLVPEDYRVEIIQRLIGRVVVRGRARVITTTRDSVEWPRLEGGNSRYQSAVRVTWVDETPASATVAGTNPTFGMVKIPVNTVMARTDLSRNLLEDSAFNLLDIMAGLFADAMAIDEDEQFLIGTGGARPKGVLGERSGAEETAVTGVTTVITGDASQLTDTGLMNLIYALDDQYQERAVLVAARNTYRDIRKIKDGEGRFVWQPGLTAGQPATVLGHAAFASEALPAIAAQKRPIIYGDWGGYVVVDRVGMSVERVVDTTTVGTNQVALFARRRLGGQVVAPWQFAVQHVSAT